MANEEQLRILKEHGAEAWNDRRGEAGEETRIDLSGADLSGAYLYRADLSCANSGPDLRAANLHEAIFNDATLGEADLRGYRIFGVFAWRLTLSEGTKQQGLILTEYPEPEITTDDIEVGGLGWQAECCSGAPRDAAPDVEETVMTGAERLARAVLLFHRGGDWTPDNLAEWEVITDSSEVTAEVLCNLARDVLADVHARRQLRRTARQFAIDDNVMTSGALEPS